MPVYSTWFSPEQKNLPSAARLRESLFSWARTEREAWVWGIWAPGSQPPPFPAPSCRGHVCWRPLLAQTLQDHCQPGTRCRQVTETHLSQATETQSPWMDTECMFRKLIPKPAHLVSNPALPLPNFIPLGNLLDFSVPQCLLYRIWIIMIPTLARFSELIYTVSAHDKDLIKVSYHYYY